MKLTQKLTLAFLLVSLIAVGLAAVFVGITTSIGFNQFLIDQRRTEFLLVVTDYYRENQTWTGVGQALREKSLIPPPQNPPPQDGAPPPVPQPFVLVDQQNMVIIPGGTFQRGQRLLENVLQGSIPVLVDGETVGRLLTTEQTASRNPTEQRYLDSVNQSLMVAALGGAALALLLGLWLARTLTHPLRDLTQATRALARGGLGQKVPVHSQDELGELAASFNQMSADLARANQARRQMTADIAHDLRNPLTVVGGYLESLQDGKLKPTPERFATMLSEVQHLQHLVEDLRTLSLADAGELTLHRQPVPPAELLERVRAAYQHRAEEAGVRLLAEPAPGLKEIALDPERMEQVLGNLVSNALRYTPDGGEIRLTASHATGQAGPLILAVQDTGSGIQPEILPHIFERSYRGDSSRSGDQSGLGLAIARSIVELHGGRIWAESQPGQGSRFLIAIPG